MLWLTMREVTKYVMKNWRNVEHLHTGRVSAADLTQIQKALTFLMPTCQLSREAQRDLMGVSLKTTALLRAHH